MRGGRRGVLEGAAREGRGRGGERDVDEGGFGGARNAGEADDLLCFLGGQERRGGEKERRE